MTHKYKLGEIAQLTKWDYSQIHGKISALTTMLGIADKISGYSGQNLDRVYLEEDEDGTLLYETCKSLGIELIIKSGYNLNFHITHNYKPELFAWKPQIGKKILFSDKEYTITGILPNKLMIVDRLGNLFRIPLSNPFNFIDSVIN